MHWAVAKTKNGTKGLLPPLNSAVLCWSNFTQKHLHHHIPRTAWLLSTSYTANWNGKTAVDCHDTSSGLDVLCPLGSLFVLALSLGVDGDLRGYKKVVIVACVPRLPTSISFCKGKFNNRRLLYWSTSKWTGEDNHMVRAVFFGLHDNTPLRPWDRTKVNWHRD